MASPHNRHNNHILRTYYQLTKPGIIYANVMTAVAGFLFASKWHINIGLFFATILGTASIIASGCVFNNFIDRGIDERMQRTKRRALVTGEVPELHAILFAAGLSILGFLILSYTNKFVVAIGALALVSYVIVYGAAKRLTPYSTLIGTIPGAASLVAGYTAVTDRLNWGALLLFLIMVVWQMPHFYAIAIRRLDDYSAAGLPVWPARKGIENTKKHILIYISVFIAVNLLLDLLGYVGYIYAVVMFALGVYWLLRGLTNFKQSDSTKWAGRMFGLSLVVLLIFSGMLSVGRILP